MLSLSYLLALKKGWAIFRIKNSIEILRSMILLNTCQAIVMLTGSCK